ncbi:MAG: hypothetical protein HRU12_17470, partial [Phaeodactylibacter sp.]|nr:hypothetical protein [Phaeodactylibacter sp.]
MRSNIFLLFSFAILGLIGFSCTPEPSIEYYSLGSTPEAPVTWTIKNEGQTDASFSISVDSLFFLDRGALANQIRKRSSSPEAVAQLAWNIVTQ